MTRKDYELIAKALATMSVPAERMQAAVIIGKALEEDNPRFDKARFVRAVKTAAQGK